MANKYNAKMQVTDEWISDTLAMLRQNPLASADVRMLIPALEELQELRCKKEKYETAINGLVEATARTIEERKKAEKGEGDAEKMAVGK